MRRRVAVIAALSLAALLGFAVQAQAATFTVGTTRTRTWHLPKPSGRNCSLRQLIRENTVREQRRRHDRRPGECQSLQLNGSELLIQQNLTIVGAGARTTTIEQTAARRPVPACSTSSRTRTRLRPTVTISGLTIEFIRPDRLDKRRSGGNILNAGNLTLSEDEIHLGQTTAGRAAASPTRAAR